MSTSHPICADSGQPKDPRACWNVRCQLGGKCCRAHADGAPASPAAEFHQLADCEGITLESNKPFAFKCCDCGLVHHMVIVSEDGRPVGFAVERVPNETHEPPENDPACTCGSDSPRAYNHALSCPHSTPWIDRVAKRLGKRG